VFCAGHAYTPDGRLLILGGERAWQAGRNAGHLTHPQTLDWGPCILQEPQFLLLLVLRNRIVTLLLWEDIEIWNASDDEKFIRRVPLRFVIFSSAT
jgi:hypothetical protein